jgi:uncharacterized protein YegP (UPF0339 family)
MKNPKFVKFTDKGGQFRFNLTAVNGQVILSSEGYSSSSACDNGIESVRKNCGLDERYEKKTAKNGKFYFVLKAGNHQVIGQSEMYASESGMNNGIESVKKNGTTENVEVSE